MSTPHPDLVDQVAEAMAGWPMATAPAEDAEAWRANAVAAIDAYDTARSAALPVLVPYLEQAGDVLVDVDVRTWLCSDLRVVNPWQPTQDPDDDVDFEPAALDEIPPPLTLIARAGAPVYPARKVAR